MYPPINTSGKRNEFNSLPGLKRIELKQFGEYRTQRYILRAYDQFGPRPVT